MKKSPILTVALALVGVLIVSIGLIALGSRESRAFPSAESYLPSGSSAFAELLRRKGFEVVIDENVKPKLQKGDLVVAFVVATPRTPFLTSEADPEQIGKTKDSITAFVKEGGSVLSLPLAPDFAEESRNLYDAELEVLSSSNVSANVTWDETKTQGFYIEGGEILNARQIWGTVEESETGSLIARESLVSIKDVGRGKDINLSNGILATNRFIDRAQNAMVLMNAVSMASPQRIVFAEASYGNAEVKGLLGTIGSWALAAWFQLIFLCIVIIYTLGKPFGLPDPERRQERGARDLMDAMAHTLRRGRMTKLALKIVLEDAHRFLRKLYRGKREPTGADLQASNMSSLQKSLTEIEAAIEIGAPEDEARKMVQRVETLMHEASAKGPVAN